MTKNNNSPQISIVLPVYRNAEMLPELYKRLCLTLVEAGLCFELIFVNDASPDESRAILQRLKERDDRVKLIDLKNNQGQQRAIREGLKQSHADYVVVLDADLQDPPEVIPELLQNLQARNLEALFAGRQGRYESSLRLITGKLFKLMLHLLINIPKDAGGYVLMSQEMVQRVLKFHGERPYLVGMIGCSGLPVASIPVSRSQRPAGKSTQASLQRLKMGLHGLLGVLFVWK